LLKAIPLSQRLPTLSRQALLQCLLILLLCAACLAPAGASEGHQWVSLNTLSDTGLPTSAGDEDLDDLTQRPTLNVVPAPGSKIQPLYLTPSLKQRPQPANPRAPPQV